MTNESSHCRRSGETITGRRPVPFNIIHSSAHVAHFLSPCRYVDICILPVASDSVGDMLSVVVQLRRPLFQEHPRRTHSSGGHAAAASSRRERSGLLPVIWTRTPKYFHMDVSNLALADPWQAPIAVWQGIPNESGHIRHCRRRRTTRGSGRMDTRMRGDGK